MVKNPPDNAGDTGMIPGSRRSPGGRNGSPLQYSCLGNPMDRGAWRGTDHGITKLDTTEQLNHASDCVKDGEGLAFLFEDRTEQKNHYVKVERNMFLINMRKAFLAESSYCGQCLS